MATKKQAAAAKKPAAKSAAKKPVVAKGAVTGRATNQPRNFVEVDKSAKKKFDPKVAAKQTPLKGTQIPLFTPQEQARQNDERRIAEIAKYDRRFAIELKELLSGKRKFADLDAPGRAEILVKVNAALANEPMEKSALSVIIAPPISNQPANAEKPATKPVKKSSKQVAATPPAPYGTKPHIHHDVNSGSHFFVIGEHKLPIDATDLSRTLGAGQYGYGKGMVDGWSDDIWKAILGQWELPAEPLNREIAQWPVKRFVQRIWFEEFRGRELEMKRVEFDSKDNVSRRKYLSDFASVKDVVESKSERAKTNLAGKGTTFKRTLGDRTYTPTAKLKDKKLTFTGQPQLILAFWRKAKYEPANIKTIVDAVVADGLKTNQPAERVVTHYLNIWKSKGYVEVA